MRWAIVLGGTALLAACSAGGTDGRQDPRGTPKRTDAAAIVQAYAQDADEADVAFAGHPLVISGDVAQVGQGGRLLLLTTGTAAERLPATVASSPHPIAPGDLVTLRCDRLLRHANAPNASGCTVTTIIPARIAHGG